MAILGTWYLSVLAVLLILACILLILVVLIQRGRGGGLAGAFGGIGGHSVLGSRTGDFLTWVTIAFAALFILLSVALDRLTPPKPEPELTENVAPSMGPTMTLTAQPADVPRGDDVTVTLSAPGEEPAMMESVEFYLGTKQDGSGNLLLGKDNYAPDGWSLTVGTGDWPLGPNSLVARVLHFDQTTSDWAKCDVTVGEPRPPAESTPPATTAPDSTPAPTTPEPTTPEPATPGPETPAPPATTAPVAPEG